MGVNDCVADLWIGDGINCDVDFVCLIYVIDYVVFTGGAGGKVNLNRWCYCRCLVLYRGVDASDQ